ncbi:MAG: hypothetical protein RSA63_00885 [Eubacterium sp.]
METSKRVQGMGEPALLKYYPLVDAVKEKGKAVYYLNIGQPDIETPPDFMRKVNEIKEQVLRSVQSALFSRGNAHYQWGE